MTEIKFFHLADIHLGYQQYNSLQRASDIATVFRNICNQAIKEKIDFMIISGDLFGERELNPLTMDQAIKILATLKKEEISIFAIEGNHDQKVYEQSFSWMDFLSRRGLLKLLKPYKTEKLFQLIPWDDELKKGSYVDYNENIRIYGIGYFGAATELILKKLEPQIKPLDFTIMLLHAGLKGYYPHSSEIGGLEYRDLAFLRKKINYLALGHWHKNYLVDNWAFNPGSIETISVRETEWPHGYYNCQIKNGKIEAKLIDDFPRRQFFVWDIDLEKNHIKNKELARKEVIDFISKKKNEIKAIHKPVIIVRLRGTLQFMKFELEIDKIKAIIKTNFEHTLIRLENLTIDRGLKVKGGKEGKKESRKDLEHRIIKELVMGTTEYQKNASNFADLMMEIKNIAVNEKNPKKILEMIKLYWGN